ncbi:MAG: hypothetical protein HOK06_05290, partial [Rhodospirillaceae bacterium]|nr:hypothetical protein [Rhodospirillaceae bacterium]
LDGNGVYTRIGADDDADADAGKHCAHSYFITNPSLSGQGSAREEQATKTPQLVTDAG